MAVVEKRLYGPAQPGAVTGVIYTVPGATSAVVKQIIMANTTALPATVTIGVGGTAAANMVIPTVVVAANSVVTLDCAIPMVAAETLNALQGTAAAVTVTISGYEF